MSAGIRRVKEGRQEGDVAEPRWFYVVLSVVAFIATVKPAAAEVSVLDGDTLRMDGVRIRLFGIDAPERGQPGAREATDHLRGLVGSERPDCKTVDYDKRNQRPVTLCAVRASDLSLAMVRAGHAVVWCSFVRKLRPAMLATMQRAEGEAKTAKRGMWARPVMAWREWGC